MQCGDFCSVCLHRFKFLTCFMVLLELTAQECMNRSNCIIHHKFHIVLSNGCAHNVN